MERTTNKPLSKQVKEKSEKTTEIEQENKGNFDTVVSTGSTLLDLAISGGIYHGGGLPGGILVEIFGPAGSGKTVLLSEIAGSIQRMGGDIRFDDPEARLNPQFAAMFGLKVTEDNYARPDTIKEVFENVRNWKPKGNCPINGSFADSLAALTTEMEMDDNDPYGMRRSKEFSEQLRLTCRELAAKNYLMVCSNQIRDVIGATKYQEQSKSPGGKGWEFYPSLRLQTSNVKKMKLEKEIADKKQERVIGVTTDIYVYKSSIWKPYHVAPVVIIFDYGIDDIRANLQFIKDWTKGTVYSLGGESLSNNMDKAIKMIESDGLEKQLKEETISLWEDIESKFIQERKPKIR
jgi:recombination protein RecA